MNLRRVMQRHVNEQRICDISDRDWWPNHSWEQTLNKEKAGYSAGFFFVA